MVVVGFADPIIFDPLAVSGDRSVRSAFAQLAEADACARSTQCSPWDFAVEIETLIAAGLTTSDLRWLVWKGYLEHGYEVTRPHDVARRFCSCHNLAFAGRTCFVLTEAGVRLVAVQGPPPPDEPRPAGRRERPQSRRPRAACVPLWDRDRRILRMDGCVVKQFRTPSPSQEVVLTAFEEQGWPAAIDDPLPPHPGHDAKRRLRSTIQNLNADQETPLLHFRSDGAGQRILWRWLPDHVEPFASKGGGACAPPRRRGGRVDTLGGADRSRIGGWRPPAVATGGGGWLFCAGRNRFGADLSAPKSLGSIRFGDRKPYPDAGCGNDHRRRFSYT